MAIKLQSSFDTSAGWTSAATAGTVTFGVTVSGKTGVEIDRTGAANFDNLGFYAATPVTGAAGDVITWDYYVAGGAVDFFIGFRRTSGLDYTTTAGIYHQNTNFRTWNGSTAGTQFPIVSNGWHNHRATIQVGGTIKFEWKLEADLTWTNIGTITTGSEDFSSGNMYFGCNLYDDSGNEPVIDSLLWTDSAGAGGIRPSTVRKLVGLGKF